MKTLTAKLAVAALLVAGSVKAAGADAWTQLVTGSMAAYNVSAEVQNAVTAWSSAQSKNPNRIKRGLSNIANYVKPLVVTAASVALTASANGCNCPHTPVFVQANSVALLAGLTVANYQWNKRSPAQVAADAQYAAAVAASVQQAAANAQASTSSSN